MGTKPGRRLEGHHVSEHGPRGGAAHPSPMPWGQVCGTPNTSQDRLHLLFRVLSHDTSNKNLGRPRSLVVLGTESVAASRGR